MGLYILIGILVLIILFIIITYNSMIKSKNVVKEAFSTMDVYLKKRWDLIPNIVETVKGYATHEKNTLTEVIALRSDINEYDSLSDEEKLKTNEKITTKLGRIMMLAESYPELKANEGFLNLQKDLGKIEEDIAMSRKYYNAVVRDYNNKIETIPNNIVAKIFGFKSKTMFNIEANEKENVKVDL